MYMDNKIFKIACVGDTITCGINIKNDEKYPAILETRLHKMEEENGGNIHYQVGNFGNCRAELYRHGSHLYTSTQEFKDAVDWAADIFVICLGSQDIFYIINDKIEEEFAEDYVSLVKKLKANSLEAKVFVALIPPIWIYPSLENSIYRINNAITRVADRCGATLLDFHRPFLGRRYLSDGYYPNQFGTEEIAATVYYAIIRSFSGRSNANE